MENAGLFNLFEQSASLYPDRICVISGEAKSTYMEINERATHCAAVLQQFGVGRGTKLILMLPANSDYLVCYYGALKAGAVVLPVSTRFSSREIVHIAQDSGANVLIASKAFLQPVLDATRDNNMFTHIFIVGLEEDSSLPPNIKSIEPALAAAGPKVKEIEVGPDDPAIVLYTSGTTGFPKGALLTHKNITAAIQIYATLNELAPGDVEIFFLPPFVVIGQILLNAIIAVGGTLSIVSSPGAREILQTIERDRGTFFCGVPTIFAMLINAINAENFDVSSLKLAMVGASPVHPELKESFEQAFHIKVNIGYGLTEYSIITIATRQMDAPPGSVGKVIPDTTIRIVDEEMKDIKVGNPGHILVKGILTMKEYLNHPRETTEVFDGEWLKTGDIGYLDENSFLYIVDRMNDMIKTGGYRVYPAEVERVLLTHDAIAEAGVVGMPHDSLGEVVCAFVVLKPGKQATDTEIKKYCKSQLVSYKSPRKIIFKDQLPKTPNGKILRRELRNEFRKL